MLGKLALIVSLAGGGLAAQKPPEPRREPVVLSLHPFTVQRGGTLVATVRGTALRGARAVFMDNATLTISVEPPQPEPGTSRDRRPIDLVKMHVHAPADAKPGRHRFRLITANGISNAVPIHVVDHSVAVEPEGNHDTPEAAVKVNRAPSVYNARLSRRGEADYYTFHARAGETYTFGVTSGLPHTAAGGSGATIANFDPSLAIYEASGSWLNPNRLKRIAFNDEPVFVFGRGTDPHLVHTFSRDGDYLLRVEAFAGQGGPDYGYQLRILPGAVPEDTPPARGDWDERGYTRALSADRLNQLAARGGSARNLSSVETYRARPVSNESAPNFKLPGTLEGVVAEPGETHRARFELDSPKDIAIEIQTPDSAPPFFNPIVRLLNSSGEEVATNVFAGKGACTGALSKSLQSKTLVPLREAGAYTVEIRDATADHSGESFRYRVQVRQQVPHIGQIRIETDHLNIVPGEANTMRVSFDREEDYRGAIAAMVEGLPPGVHATIGADFEPDKDPPSAIGKRERYTPRTERMVVVFTAAPEATPTSEPVIARVVVRPVAGGKVGDVIATKTFPVMVVTP